MKITKEGFAILENDTHIGKWVEESGRIDHDQNMLPLVLRYINYGDVVIDVGANIGSHTVAYANKVGDEGLVIAYEANREAYACLVHNTKGLNVQPLMAAIGNTIGLADVISLNDNVGMAFVKPSDNGDVVLLTLDIELRYLQSVDFIKIDVEGFEVEVLEGAKTIIEKHKPKMLIEINEACLNRNGKSKQDVFSLLDSFGYSYGNIYSEQGLEEAQFDILCLKNR
jgi:FkbM family methyltransferase